MVGRRPRSSRVPALSPIMGRNSGGRLRVVLEGSRSSRMCGFTSDRVRHQIPGTAVEEASVRSFVHHLVGQACPSLGDDQGRSGLGVMSGRGWITAWTCPARATHRQFGPSGGRVGRSAPRPYAQKVSGCRAPGMPSVITIKAYQGRRIAFHHRAFPLFYVPAPGGTKGPRTRPRRVRPPSSRPTVHRNNGYLGCRRASKGLAGLGGGLVRRRDIGAGGQHPEGPLAADLEPVTPWIRIRALASQEVAISCSRRGARQPAVRLAAAPPGRGRTA